MKNLLAVVLLCCTAGAQTSDSSIRFRDISKESGVNVPHLSTPEKRYIIESMSGGVALFDCDNDGHLDIATVNGSSVERFRKGGDPLVTLYHQSPAKAQEANIPRFENITERAGLSSKGWSMGVTAADFDGDGNIDLFVTGYGGNTLYRNLGNCKFQDVTERAGVHGGGFSTGSAWADYDGDGNIDLFVSRYVSVDLNKLPEFGSKETCRYKGILVQCGPRGLPGEGDLLYHNNGDGTFTEVAKKAHVNDAPGYYGLGVSWFDYDDDGWPDLFVANDSSPNYLYHNNHDGTFTDISTQAGIAYSEDGNEQGSMGVGIGDFDGDGRLDIFVTNFVQEPNALYRNLSHQGFVDQVQRARIGSVSMPYVGWGTALSDFDDDGWPDILIANGHVYPQVDVSTSVKPGTGYRQAILVFRNLADGTFKEVSAEAGLAALPLASRRGAAFGDLNNDGFIDVVIVNVGEAPTVLLNVSSPANNAVTLVLSGKGRNHAAIGARVTLTANKRKQVKEVQAGSSYLSQNDSRLHFGIGSAKEVSVEIRWPDRQIQNVSGIRAEQIVTITQGKGITAARSYAARPK